MNRPDYTNKQVDWVPCISHSRNVIHAFANARSWFTPLQSACGDVYIKSDSKHYAKWHRAENCIDLDHTANFTICDDCASVFIMQELAS